MFCCGRRTASLGVTWIAAHSPQAKGRVERSFGTAQDRLVKGLRVAGARTLEQANAYLEEEFLPWWNQHLRVLPAHPADAHRRLGGEHDPAASLSHVEMRQVGNDYTIRWDSKLYRIDRTGVRPGMRGGLVRVEQRLDGTLAVRFRDRYVRIEEGVRARKRCRHNGQRPSTAPSQRSSDLPRGARLPSNIDLNLNPLSRCGSQNRTFLLGVDRRNARRKRPAKQEPNGSLDMGPRLIRIGLFF